MNVTDTEEEIKRIEQKSKQCRITINRYKLRCVKLRIFRSGFGHFVSSGRNQILDKSDLTLV